MTPTQAEMQAAIDAINEWCGFDIRAPWECDLDDREMEQFNGLCAAVAAAMRVAAQVAATNARMAAEDTSGPKQRLLWSPVHGKQIAAAKADPFKRDQVEEICRAVCAVEGIDPDEDMFGGNCDANWTRYADAVAGVVTVVVQKCPNYPGCHCNEDCLDGWVFPIAETSKPIGE